VRLVVITAVRVKGGGAKAVIHGVVVATDRVAVAACGQGLVPSNTERGGELDSVSSHEVAEFVNLEPCACREMDAFLPGEEDVSISTCDPKPARVWDMRHGSNATRPITLVKGSLRARRRFAPTDMRGHAPSGGKASEGTLEPASYSRC
jgi:hypothetical protein